MIENKNILVTVLMPVFNSELYISEAINSILKQTYQNFEFLIINDGSTDSSDKIIRSFEDSRIKYIDNKINKGIVSTLNQGLEYSTGKYIARMDADDISAPTRLAKQVNFLETNPDYKLCGSQAFAINSSGKQTHKLNRPLSHHKIKVFNLFRNAFIHPTIMAHADIMKGFSYSESNKYAEDYLLFSQITMMYKVINLRERFLYYRIHEESITSQKEEEMKNSELKTMAYLLSSLFDDIPTKTLLIHHNILRPNENKISLNEMESHLINISKANKIKKIFNQLTLNKQLQKEWFNCLIRSRKKSLKSFISSDLFHIRDINLKQILKLIK